MREWGWVWRRGWLGVSQGLRWQSQINWGMRGEEEVFGISCQAQEGNYWGFRVEDWHSLIFLLNNKSLPAILRLPNREWGGSYNCRKRRWRGRGLDLNITFERTTQQSLPITELKGWTREKTAQVFMSRALIWVLGPLPEVWKPEGEV